MLPVCFSSRNFRRAKISTFSGKNCEQSSSFKVSQVSIVQHPSCMSMYQDLYHNLASSDRCIVVNVILASSMTVFVVLKYCSRSNMKFSKAFASLAPQKSLSSKIFTLLTKIAPPTGAWFTIARIVRFSHFKSAISFLTTSRVARKSSDMLFIISKRVF